eukprot:TRINITY_DN12673_c0_g1_i1.p1 TRINITY_DN12673_c0_g1~~TRINITY_DN12673_c0_g1_i1.p1  ORF type:complete len:459 (+),score=95.19 TRINITY_DN12673_c0_g1_i1:97-1473(+)
MHRADQENTNMPQTRESLHSHEDNANDNKSFSSHLLLYTRLWLWSLTKALAIVVPVLLVLWIFCLPSLIWKDSLSESLRELIYVKIQAGLLRLSLYGYVSVYAVAVFGMYFVQQPLFHCILPGTLASIYVDISLELDVMSHVIFGLVIVGSILLMFRKKLPESPSLVLLGQFQRKNETSAQLGKTTMSIFVVYFIFFALYPIFLEAELKGKVLIRFVIVPIIMTCCTSLQMHILKSVPMKHTSFVIPMLWITSGYMKMFERIFTNSMFKSGDYLSFSATAMMAAIMEIFNHATYFYRTELIEYLLRKMEKLKKPKIRNLQAGLNFQSIEENNQLQMMQARLQEKSAWIGHVRKLLIIEDISIELMMIVVVTFLLYFLHPLVDDEKFETIPSFEICIVQLLIQIAFELVSDIFGIFWTIKKQNIELKIEQVQVINKWFWVWVFLVLYQSFVLFWIFLRY